MTDHLPAPLVRAALGLVLDAVLGMVARRGRFCTLGAIDDAVYARDTRRARAWLLTLVGFHLPDSGVGRVGERYRFVQT